MSSGSDASPPIVEGDSNINPYAAWESLVAKVKWIFLTVALVSPFACQFLDFLLPRVSTLLLFIAFFCWIFLILSFLVSLFRRRWRSVAIFTAVWILISLPFFGVREQYIWLRVQGFRIHIAPIEKYLASCTLYDFVEGGTRQTVGTCKSSWDGPIETTVFYDSSRQFKLPASQRTAGWKQAMSHFTDSHILIDSDNRAHHLFEEFYEVSTNIAEMKGG
jgi:hypothetical protein